MMGRFDCYKQDVNDAYKKLLDNEEYFSNIADEIYIDDWRIAFKFEGGVYHLSPHSINCNGLSEVRDALLRSQDHYSAKRKKVNKQ